MRAIGATLTNRWFELKWIDSGSGRHALLQSLEQAAEAAGRDDRTGTLGIGPDRLTSLGCQLSIALHEGEHGPSDRRIGIELGENTWREINNLLCQANALCQLAESPPIGYLSCSQ